MLPGDLCRLEPSINYTSQTLFNNQCKLTCCRWATCVRVREASLRVQCSHTRTSTRTRPIAAFDSSRELSSDVVYLPLPVLMKVRGRTWRMEPIYVSTPALAGAEKGRHRDLPARRTYPPALCPIAKYNTNCVDCRRTCTFLHREDRH